ncbi:MAG: hypothetical protein WCV90_07305 [Candidatus Woesearchaeota archaeon]|jgi:hypothetical protein
MKLRILYHTLAFLSALTISGCGGPARIEDEVVVASPEKEAVLENRVEQIDPNPSIFMEQEKSLPTFPSWWNSNALQGLRDNPNLPSLGGEVYFVPSIDDSGEGFLIGLNAPTRTVNQLRAGGINALLFSDRWTNPDHRLTPPSLYSPTGIQDPLPSEVYLLPTTYGGEEITLMGLEMPKRRTTITITPPLGCAAEEVNTLALRKAYLNACIISGMRNGGTEIRVKTGDLPLSIIRYVP